MECLYCPCKLGLILIEGKHRPTIDVQHLNLKEIAVPGIPGEGPDLAYIGLPRIRAQGISSIKSFYDRDVDREEMLNNPPDPHSAVWFVNGIPDEFTRDVIPSGGFDGARLFEGLCGAGGPDKLYEQNGYDYIDMIVEYEEENRLPTTFGGISGGGLWQVTFSSRENGIEPNRYLLSGLPFAETREIINRRRIIYCHGPRSIFDNVYSVVRG